MAFCIIDSIILDTFFVFFDSFFMQTSSKVQNLHFRFRMYGRNAREWTRKCALLLPEIVRERVWEKKGFDSVYTYARVLAGMGREAVNDALRILEKVEGMPAIRQVIQEKGINSVKPLMTILNETNQDFLAEKARLMSKNTLEMYVREWKMERPRTLENDEFPEQQAIAKKIIALDLDPEVARKLEKLKGKDGNWNALMKELLEMREKMLAQGKPAEKVTESRHIPVAIERYVVDRARGVCEIGTCIKKYEILHHTQRFALEKTHDPSRIVALCRPHERMVHLGLIEDEYILPREWKILDEADESDPKYVIDQMVQKYRRPI